MLSRGSKEKVKKNPFLQNYKTSFDENSFKDSLILLMYTLYTHLRKVAVYLRKVNKNQLEIIKYFKQTAVTNYFKVSIQ